MNATLTVGPTAERDQVNKGAGLHPASHGTTRELDTTRPVTSWLGEILIAGMLEVQDEDVQVPAAPTTGRDDDVQVPAAGDTKSK